MKRILCLWFPNWPVQRFGLSILTRARAPHRPDTGVPVATPQETGAYRAAPYFSGTAITDNRASSDLVLSEIVLYSHRPRAGKRVRFCSNTAWDQGIRPEMTVAEATTVLRKRQNHHPFYIDEHDPNADRMELERLASECHQFSPLVGLEASEGLKATASEPSSLLFDISGSAPRLGGEQSVAQQIIDFVGGLGYRARIGIAHTIGAASAFAHTTDHIAIIPTEHVADQLALLPIQALRLAPATGDLLTQLGVRRIGELLRLPRASLQARFGSDLLLRIDQATGRVAEAIETQAPPVSFSVTRRLEHAITRRDAIEQMTGQLVEQLCERLVEQDQEAVQLVYRLSLASETDTTTDLSVGLYQPTARPKHIVELLHMQLESIVLGHPVQRATLTATLTVARADEQHNLFDTSAAPSPRQLAHLIDRLSSRLGADRVVSAHLSCEPQVEKAYQYRALAGRRRRVLGTVCEPESKPFVCTRPLSLIHPPVAIGIPTAEGDLRQHPPTMFYHRGRQHQTTAYWGPERIETGWWRGASVRRDYFHVENEEGSRFWLFRDLRRDRWFLHGEFL